MNSVNYWDASCMDASDVEYKFTRMANCMHVSKIECELLGCKLHSCFKC